MSIEPRFDARSAALSVTDLESERDLALRSKCLMVLTLEHDPEATFVRGHVHAIGRGAKYPIQSNVALFEALSEYLSLESEK